MRRAVLPSLLLLLPLAGCPQERDDGSDPPPPSMTIEPALTISGTTVIERGECIGFRIQTERFPLTDPRVYLGPFGNGSPMYEISAETLLVLDGDTIQVGFPCLYTSLGMPLGEANVTVIDGGATLSAPAFTVVDTTRVDLGDAPAASDLAIEDDANELGHAHDFDVYVWGATPALWSSEVLVVDTANEAFKPYQFVVRRDGGGSWNGHEVVFAPVGAAIEVLSQVADDTTGGGEGYRYALAVDLVPDPVAAIASDACDATATTAGLFSIDLAGAANDYDPAGAETCADRHVPQPPFPGEGVRAPGADRAWKVRVAAGATLQVVAFSLETDVALYVRPDCAATPCLAAVDTFGAGATETLVWRNPGAALDAWLIVDSAGGTPASVTVRIRGIE